MHRFIATILIAVSLQLAAAPPAAADPEGRWVDFGPWNGVVDCEASPNAGAAAIVTPTGTHLTEPGTRRHAAEVRVDQRAGAADRGAFQFIPSTWDWVAAERGRRHLTGDDPRRKTLATQLRQAEWLRLNGGIGHWTCGYRYGDGTGPRYVTGELRMPAHPGRCTVNLVNIHGIGLRSARSVCGAR